MSSKCFCHLNGLAVKDATARNDIQKLISDISNISDKLDKLSFNSIQTINGTTLKFFVGDQATYNALSKNDKQDLFAIITDDTTKEELFSAIEELNSKVADLEGLKSIVETCESDIDTCESNIEECKTNIQKNTDDIETATSKIEELENFNNSLIPQPHFTSQLVEEGYYSICVYLNSLPDWYLYFGMIYWLNEETGALIPDITEGNKRYMLRIKTDGTFSLYKYENDTLSQFDESEFGVYTTKLG